MVNGRNVMAKAFIIYLFIHSHRLIHLLYAQGTRKVLVYILHDDTYPSKNIKNLDGLIKHMDGRKNQIVLTHALYTISY